jgi:hypothetical protein
MLAKFVTSTFFSTPVFPYWLAWVDFLSIWEIVERRNDLERLVAWARRKKLKGVREHYKFLLMETEIHLADKNIRHHKLFMWATTLNLVFRMICPSPTSYKKGAAVRYKL